MSEETGNKADHSHEVVTKRPDKPWVTNAETTRLLEHLRGMQIGEVVTYDELFHLYKTDYQADYRSAWDNARRNLPKEGVLVACIRGVGYKRVDDSEFNQVCENDVKSVRRKTKRTLKNLRCVRPDKLKSEAERTMWGVHVLRMSAMHSISKAKPKQVSGTDKNISRFLEALNKQNGESGKGE